MKIVILKCALRTFCLQNKFSWNCRIHRDQVNDKTTQKNAAAKTSHNKIKSALNTATENVTGLSIISFMHHHTLHLHYARILCNILSFLSSKNSVLCCKPDDNCVLPGMLAHTVSPVMCSLLHTVHFVSVRHWNTHNASPLSVWLIHAITNTFGRFCIPNNLTFKNKSAQLWKIRVKNSKECPSYNH
jgi:hypothetical protein